MVISNFIVSFAMSASLNQLWGMIHGLQIMTHMPLCNIKFPANAESFNGFMMQVAVFDVIPSDYILSKTVYFPQEDPFSLNFELLDF